MTGLLRRVRDSNPHDGYPSPDYQSVAFTFQPTLENVARGAFRDRHIHKICTE